MTVKRLVRARRALREEATAVWRVPGVVADFMMLLPFIGAFIVAAAWADRPFFHFLTDEDHFLEWIQFTGDAIAAVAAGVVVIALARGRATGRLWILLWCGLAAGCFFLAGEEISWGQRVFGWGTPDQLASVNHQGETTLHNIGGVLLAMNVLMMLMGAYGAFVPWAARSMRLGGEMAVRRLLVPPLFLTASWFMLFAYKGLRLTAFREKSSAVVSFGEWPETCLAFSLAGFTVLTYLRLRRQTAVAASAPAPAAGVVGSRA